jgi:mono/diheme cytochrome c family protein
VAFLTIRRNATRAATLAVMSLAHLFAADAANLEIERSFAQTVRPFLAAYCVSCHNGTAPAAQLDLRRYASVADVVRDHSRWALVAGKLAAMEMPPKAMKQPPAAERQQVIDWVHAMRAGEARKTPGDPGLVLMRRLSNAEYNYSIRDLTGADIRPTREFPVDPVNPAGFDNSGESLAMSPALLNKYLQAARQVASHLVLKPAGFEFAPHPMLAESDCEKYAIQRIVDFYDRQPTGYAAYFLAAWRFKHRAATGQPDATLEDFAREAKISAKYLPLIWEILEEAKDDVGPVARLRTMWGMLPGPEHDQTELVREACVKMRDYVMKIRKLTARQFRSPRVRGLAGTSQPLMNWKLRAFAANRRDFDRSALQVEGEPPIELPVMPKARGVPTEDEVGMRNAALTIRTRFGDPDLLVPAGQRERYEASFARFASVFPDAFYIRERGRFYPDDSEDKGRLLSAGFHNVMGYFRDDTPLMELILDEPRQKELDMLWLEFDTVADFTTRTYTQFYFNQSGEIEGRGRESGSFRPSNEDITAEKTIFGIRDAYLNKAESGLNKAETGGDDLAKEAIREHFARVNAKIREVEKARLDSQPTHLDALLRFATRAYRRPLTQSENDSLLGSYRSFRENGGLSHEDAMRDMVVLVLMSPDFSYRVDLVEPGARKTAPVLLSRKKSSRVQPAASKVAADKARPLSDYALASRLSYFLWASLPDGELMARAAAGDLHEAEVLIAQVRRMVKDKRALALATEFAGNWLGFRRFEDHNSVDRGRFPAFTNELRQAMFEEPVRFIDDTIRNGRSMLDLLYGKHTFVNGVLARHYGMEDLRIKPGDWVRVDDAERYGRGGVLPMAAFLTQNAPGLRTSPVKRGYWVARQLLGEAIPPPPPTVPELPADESKMDLPLRQLLATHRQHPACAGCHQRFDGFGLAFEGYGPVGEQRTKDLAGRAVDTRAEFPGGGQGTGVVGLVDCIRSRREPDYVSNLCRKVLVYALGRGLQLSDEPLLEQMRSAFASGGHRFPVLIESIVVSPQFLNQRNSEHGAKKGD